MARREQVRGVVREWVEGGFGGVLFFEREGVQGDMEQGEKARGGSVADRRGDN